MIQNINLHLPPLNQCLDVIIKNVILRWLVHSQRDNVMQRVQMCQFKHGIVEFSDLLNTSPHTQMKTVSSTHSHSPPLHIAGGSRRVCTHILTHMQPSCPRNNCRHSRGWKGDAKLTRTRSKQRYQLVHYGRTIEQSRVGASQKQEAQSKAGRET